MNPEIQGVHKVPPLNFEQMKINTRASAHVDINKGGDFHSIRKSYHLI